MAGKKSGKARDGSPSVPKKAPPPGKRYFLATMDGDLIKQMKQAAIAEDASASECLEIAAQEWLARRVSQSAKS
jgi:hypothetical protein